MTITETLTRSRTARRTTRTIKRALRKTHSRGQMDHKWTVDGEVVVGGYKDILFSCLPVRQTLTYVHTQEEKHLQKHRTYFDLMQDCIWASVYCCLLLTVPYESWQHLVISQLCSINFRLKIVNHSGSVPVLWRPSVFKVKLNNQETTKATASNVP